MPPAIMTALRARPPRALPLATDEGLSFRELLQSAGTAETASGVDGGPVISLLGPQGSDSEAARAAREPADWPQMLELVQNFGARVRRANALAQDLTAQSQELITRSAGEVEAATARAEWAEAAARDAARYVEQAREQVRTAEERARLAEEQLRAVQASEAEARHWLGRIYGALCRECDSLQDVFANEPAAADTQSDT